MSELISNKFKVGYMKGVSPFVSMVLVMAFGFAAMAIVVAVVNPMLDRAKDSGIVNEAVQNTQLLDSAIKAVASEARGSKRTIHVKITEGVLRSDAGKELMYLDYDPKTAHVLDGFSGDVRIESRPVFLEYFNQYNNDANANDTWTSVNGTWSVSSNRLLGIGGIAYHSLNNRRDFEFTASVIPSTSPYGQVYLVPGEPKDLVLYLPFDGTSNDTYRIAHDYSAYKNNGTLSNGTSATCFTNNACPSFTAGRFGNATDYDEIGDFINVSRPSSLNITGSLTISAWVYPKNFNGGQTGIVAKWAYGINNRTYMIQTGGNGFQFYINSDGTTAGRYGVQNNALISNNTWYHVVGVWNGVTSSVYMNGVNSTASSPLVGGPPASIYARSTADLLIGAENGGLGGSPADSFFNGTIDEVMIFNRALTANEVAFLYQTSERKVTSSGEIQPVGEDANVTIVLASPESTYFDNIKFKAGEPLIRFIIPYNRIDIEQLIRFGPGDHNIVIKHNGTNATTNRPLIRIEE